MLGKSDFQRQPAMRFRKAPRSAVLLLLNYLVARAIGRCKSIRWS